MRSIHSTKRDIDPTSHLADGAYVIMRKIPSYRVYDFADDNPNPIYASQFFYLVDCIIDEGKREQREIERSKVRK